MKTAIIRSLFPLMVAAMLVVAATPGAMAQGAPSQDREPHHPGQGHGDRVHEHSVRGQDPLHSHEHLHPNAPSHQRDGHADHKHDHTHGEMMGEVMPGVAALPPLPVRSGHSLHLMRAEWTDHLNREFRLADLSGTPVILVMFYGQCTGTCPILIWQTWKLYQELSPEVQQRTQVLAVSFDHDNDTPDVLRQYATPAQLALPNWHFATSSPRSIRELATLVGVQYRKRSDGHYDHTNLITLLDEEGNIIDRMDSLAGDIRSAAKKLDSLAHQP